MLACWDVAAVPVPVCVVPPDVAVLPAVPVPVAAAVVVSFAVVVVAVGVVGVLALAAVALLVGMNKFIPLGTTVGGGVGLISSPVSLNCRLLFMM